MKKTIKKLILVQILIFTSFNTNFADDNDNRDNYDFQVNNIYINRHNVFEKTDEDWFFAGNFANFLHPITKEFIIADELLFAPDQFIIEANLSETERNLRSSMLFTDVSITIDSVGIDYYDVYVETKDRWSLYPQILFGTGGGNTRYGGRIEEFNFLGTGTYFSAEGLSRSENDIGNQYNFGIMQRRLFRSELGLTYGITTHQYRTIQLLAIEKPYRTLETTNSYGITLSNNDGYDFIYSDANNFEKIKSLEQRASIYYSHGWLELDKVFITGLFSYENIDRYKPEYERAFDNTAKFLLQFSSVSNDFRVVNNINHYHKSDLCIGGYGRAVLGKTFSINDKGESLYYIAGEGEQSYYNGKLYLFAGVKGSSGFVSSIPVYTYQEINGLAFYQFNKFFILGGRLRQQTTWNWHNRDRQLILDNEKGLRGYTANNLVGDNRLFSNLELRVFPDFRFWVLSMSGVLFWDAGIVWNAGQKVYKQRWHNSVGTGLRFHFTKSSSPRHTFRLDVAYNCDEKRMAEIMLSSQQFFSFFSTHKYKKPKIFGLEYDYE